MSDEADYIIIGAGSAGCVVANRLSQDSAGTVTLLEAGPPDRHPFLHIPSGSAKVFTDHRFNWKFQSEPEPELNGRRLYCPRGKTLGGTSAINGLAYIRGNPTDYDAWAQAGNTGWDWDSVLPLFRKSEANVLGASEAHGADGEMAVSFGTLQHKSSRRFLDAAKTIGIPETRDFNDGDQEGCGWLQFNIGNGRRQSSSHAFLRPVQTRPNLRIETGALVEKINIADGRAVSVSYRKGSEDRTLKARKEVIVCGGAISSPQILMLSGIGPADHLRDQGIEVIRDLSGVGRNLQDHTYLHAICGVHPEWSINRDLKGVRFVWQVLKYALTRTGLLSLGVSNACLFTTVTPGAAAPDIQIMVRPISTNFVSTGSLQVQDDPGITIAACPVRPKSRGFVALRSAAPSDAPRIQYNLFTAPGDWDVQVRGYRLIEKLLGTPPLKDIVTTMRRPDVDVSSDEALIDYARDNATTVFHPVGTCRMGQDDMSVVDERLRVRGIVGLRVADASIMPSIVSGNTHAPTVMIGEKCAEMVRQDSREGASIQTGTSA